MKHMRKLVKQGGSYTLSIPKGFVEYNEIKDDQEVVILMDGKIVIYPSEVAYNAEKEKARKFLEEK